jgi:hypothetical protein
MAKINVGWSIGKTLWSDLLYFDPEQLKVEIPCPAIFAWTMNTFVIKAPFDLHLRCRITANGPELQWLNQVENVSIHNVVQFTRRDLWSAPDKPSIQWLLNNIFVADEPVIAEAWQPQSFYRKEPLPGVVIPSYLDIQKWTRPIQWAFEWRDINKDLVIKRGEPIQYIRFQGKNYNDVFKLKQLDFNEDMEAAVKRCKTMLPFKKNMLSLSDALLKKRPAKWLD